MSVPVIDPTTSILALTRGRFCSVQLALASGSVPATSWALASGGFPDGLTLNTATGRISGTPSRESEGSGFVAEGTARNASGPNAPPKLVFGIEHSMVEPDGSLEALMEADLRAQNFHHLPTSVGWRAKVKKAILQIGRCPENPARKQP